MNPDSNSQCRHHFRVISNKLYVKNWEITRRCFTNDVFRLFLAEDHAMLAICVISKQCSFHLYKIRPESSCFGITSLISDNNQGGPCRKPHNKITQSGVWAFNTVKRRIAVAKDKKNRLMELARLISRKTKKTL